MSRVNREDVPDTFAEMMQTESHHSHEIIKDQYGVIRWKEDDFVRRLIDASSVSCIVEELFEKGHSKNSEIMRELYRNMGYSLDGYWEVFYWEFNNAECAEYAQPITALPQPDRAQMNDELPPQPIEVKIIFMIQSDKVVGGESEEYQVTERYWHMAVKERHMTTWAFVDGTFVNRGSDGMHRHYKVLDHDAFLEHRAYLESGGK